MFHRFCPHFCRGLSLQMAINLTNSDIKDTLKREFAEFIGEQVKAERETDKAGLGLRHN